MGLAACLVAEMQQEGGEGVGDGGALQGQHAIFVVHDVAVDVEAGGELGGIGDGDLDEDEVLIIGEVVIPQDLQPLLGVLGGVAGVGFVGDQPDGAAGAVANEQLGLVVEFDVG